MLCFHNPPKAVRDSRFWKCNLGCLMASLKTEVAAMASLDFNWVKVDWESPALRVHVLAPRACCASLQLSPVQGGGTSACPGTARGQWGAQNSRCSPEDAEEVPGLNRESSWNSPLHFSVNLALWMEVLDMFCSREKPSLCCTLLVT